VDPLEDLLHVARAAGLWYHVDGAYGAFGAALPELAERYRGMDQADSLTLDPHKWLYVPYEAGCILVRDRDALTRAFATRAEYLEVRDDDYFNGPLWFYQQGPQLSRGFRALKVWAVVRQVGLDAYRTLWRNDIAAAAEMRKLCEQHPRLEPVGVTDLSICCFRYLPPNGDPDKFNQRLLDKIQQDGRSFVSGTTVGGKFCLRACIMNFRTTLDDVRSAIEAVTELADDLAATTTAT
jgi:aromatic-L-amino-acid/L-tryptophan decarboxylase